MPLERKIKFHVMGFARNRAWVSSEIVGSFEIANEILRELKDLTIYKKKHKTTPKKTILDKEVVFKDLIQTRRDILPFLRMDGFLWIRTDQAPDWVDEMRKKGKIPDKTKKSLLTLNLDALCKTKDSNTTCFVCHYPITDHGKRLAKIHLAKTSNVLEKTKNHLESV